MKYTTILVDLDCILDTRLPLLLKTFPDKEEEIFSIYFDRQCNDFPGIINYKDFNDLYLSRDKTILRQSVMTSIPLLLNDFVINTIDYMVSNSVPFPPKIILNLYPYDLQKEEIDAVLLGLLIHLDKRVDLEVVSMKNTDITYSFLYKHISAMIKFDYYNWLDDNTPLLKNRNERCPDVKLITPAYFPMEHKNLKEIFYHEGKIIDPFQMFHIGMLHVINMEFVKPSKFNMVFKGNE